MVEKIVLDDPVTVGVPEPFLGFDGHHEVQGLFDLLQTAKRFLDILQTLCRRLAVFLDAINGGPLQRAVFFQEVFAVILHERALAGCLLLEDGNLRPFDEDLLARRILGG